ncbi:hypothetical protein Tco_0059050 [Tanacetum coccineum]
MSSPSSHIVPETITPTDRTRDSLVITPLHDDPYMLVRQAYIPIPINTKFDPFEDLIETKETQPLSPRAAPLSPDYTPASLDYTSDIPHTDKDTARMAVHTQPTLSPDISARVTEAMALSPSSFYTETEDDESEAKGTGLESQESKDEGPDSESEEAASEEQQQAVSVEDAVADEPLGLRYRAARLRALELAEGPAPYIECVMPLVRALVQTLTSHEWSSGSLPISLTSLTVPSPVASLETTLAATIAVEEDELIEVGAQLELHGSILHEHTQRLDALTPTLFERYGRDFTRLFARSEAVRDEIHSLRFRLRSPK